MKVRQRISPKLIFDLRPFTFSIAETLHYNLLQLTKDLILYLPTFHRRLQTYQRVLYSFVQS